MKQVIDTWSGTRLQHQLRLLVVREQYAGAPKNVSRVALPRLLVEEDRHSVRRTVDRSGDHVHVSISDLGGACPSVNQFGDCSGAKDEDVKKRERSK